MSPHEIIRVLNLTLKTGYKAKDGRQFSQALFTKVERSDRSDEGLGSMLSAVVAGLCMTTRTLLKLLCVALGFHLETQICYGIFSSFLV